MEKVQETTGLNDIQLTLLRLFNRKMSQEETVELRDMLFNFYSDKLFNEVDKVVKQKNITEQDYEKLRNQNQRNQL